MNMAIRPADFTLPETSEISLLINGYNELEALMARSCGISDDAMDAIVQAQSEIGEAITDAPATTPKDIAAKFRLLANLVDDEDAGMLYLEPELLLSACRDLAQMRCSAWKGRYLEAFETANPFYAYLVNQAA